MRRDYYNCNLDLVGSLKASRFFYNLEWFLRDSSGFPNYLEYPPVRITLEVFGCACEILTDFSAVEAALGYLRELVDADSESPVRGAQIHYHIDAFAAALVQVIHDSCALTDAVLQFGLPDDVINRVSEMKLPKAPGLSDRLWSIKKAVSEYNRRNVWRDGGWRVGRGKAYDKRLREVGGVSGRGLWGAMDNTWAAVLESTLDDTRGQGTLWKDRILETYETLSEGASEVQQHVMELFSALTVCWRERAGYLPIPPESAKTLNTGDGEGANGEVDGSDDENPF